MLVSAVGPVEVGGLTVPAPVVVAYGTAVGVFIDLDHFVIARFKTGTWDPLRFSLVNPFAAFTDQDRIFDRGDVGALTRLLSHLMLTGILVPALALASVSLAVITAVVLYAHVVADVAWDVRRLERTDVSADDLIRSP
nr:hypothetical protein [Natronococcus sp. AD5]